MWLDDQSGQMVGYQGRIMVSSQSAEDITAEVDGVALPKSVSILAEFCRTYYPVDSVNISDKTLTSYIHPSGSFIHDYEISLVQYQESLVETYPIPVRLRGEYLFFNL